jgi:pectate lyase
MLLLLMICGGMLPVCLAGCTDTILHPYRPIYTDGGTGGTGDLDAGTDSGPISCPPTALVGYATLDGGTTGGGDGPVYTADTLTQLRNYASVTGPAIIRINGTIALQWDGGQPVELTSDKTVIPVHVGDGLIYGGLRIKGEHNVIVRNLTIAKAPNINGADAITIQSANNVWVDHCDLSSELTSPKGTYDGLVDTVHGSKNITVSWNRFHDHYAVSLVGHTDDATTAAAEDAALAVTFHHNLYQNIVQGAPRARFGHVHLFSNYYNIVQLPSDPTSSYAIASTDGAILRVEVNVFEKVPVPIVTFLNDNSNITVGSVADVDNLYVPPYANVIWTPQNSWKPPYQYADSVDLKESVRPIVTLCAGTGKVP